VKIESIFDNGNGRMIRTTDIFVRMGIRENLVRARKRASKLGSREGGSMEWRYIINERMNERLNFMEIE